MKNIFIPVNMSLNIKEYKINKISKKIPKNIIIAYSIQYKKSAKEIKKILSKNHNILGFIQVLGCSKPKISSSTEAILLISSGKFHAISLAYETKLPIYIYNTKLEKISEKEVSDYEKKQKASYLKYLSSDKIGIIISAKPGQQRFEKALEIKKELKDKKSYLFIADNINIFEFQNFKVDSWINTACPRMDMDDFKIINMSKIE